MRKQDKDDLMCEVRLEARKYARREMSEMFFKIFLSIIACAILFGAVYMISVTVDDNRDIKYCEAGAKLLINESYSGLSCYAVGDMNKINFGKNIDCDCFYKTWNDVLGRDGTESVEFIYGEENEKD